MFRLQSWDKLVGWLSSCSTAQWLECISIYSVTLAWTTWSGIGGRYWPVVDLHLKFNVCVDCEMLFEWCPWQMERPRLEYPDTASKNWCIACEPCLQYQYTSQLTAGVQLVVVDLLIIDLRSQSSLVGCEYSVFRLYLNGDYDLDEASQWIEAQCAHVYKCIQLISWYQLLWLYGHRVLLVV